MKRPLTDEELASLEYVLDYVWDDERDDFRDNYGDEMAREHHIFVHLVKLNNYLNDENNKPEDFFEEDELGD